jgi:hypothetical protein
MDDHISLELEWKLCDNCHKELLNTGSAASGVSGIEIFPDKRERERDEDNTASTVFAM